MSKTQPKTKTATRRDVFARAIEIIAKRGWVQDAFTSHGKVCAVQAVREAAKQLKADRFISYCGDGLMSYNDSKGRTKYDVYLKLAQLASK